MVNRIQDESLLIEKISEGKEYAFEIAFLKYYGTLCKYVWKYVRSNALSEEIVQDVFADIWENKETLDPEGNLKGLLYVSVRNKALDFIKHKKIVDDYEKQISKLKGRQISSPNNQRNKGKKRVRKKYINEAINQLPPKARQVFLLNREEGLTYQEIANYLGISVKTVESQISRVLKILRERLSHLPLFN